MGQTTTTLVHMHAMLQRSMIVLTVPPKRRCSHPTPTCLPPFSLMFFPSYLTLWYSALIVRSRSGRKCTPTNLCNITTMQHRLRNNRVKSMYVCNLAAVVCCGGHHRNPMEVYTHIKRHVVVTTANGHDESRHIGQCCQPHCSPSLWATGNPKPAFTRSGP